MPDDDVAGEPAGPELTQEAEALVLQRAKAVSNRIQERVRKALADEGLLPEILTDEPKPLPP